MTDTSVIQASGGRVRRGPRGPRRRAGSNIGYFFVAPYVVLLAAFGLVPVLYAIYLAFTNLDGGFAGVTNFTKSAGDFRFLPAVQHVAVFLVVWVVVLVVLVVVLSLAMHQLAGRRLATTMRFVYYLPGALAGASSVLLWLFVLDPSVSPVSWVLGALGYDGFVQAIAPGHLPVIFTLIAFWTGAGGWIVVMHGALNSIPHEVLEAARIDGASPVQLALHIQLPMIRKWITYMAVIALAGGTQLFVEPQLVSQASFGVVGNDYSLNQLAYLYAFQQNDFNGAAAISLDLLVVALLLAAGFVARGGLFDKD